jgi:uncharacterized protein (DUF433 family)
MNWQVYIETNDEILLGKPTIKGTRLSVEHIIKLLASGWTEQQILDNYPRLTRESFQAVFSYIHEFMKDGLIYTKPLKSA